MGTDHRVRRPSVFILWLAISFYLVSICRGDVRDFVTEDFFNIIVSGDVPLSVEGIATQDFFNGILSAATAGCAGKSFYKHNDFITATNSFSGFGRNGTSDDNKREIAAFFAHVAHETISLCYIEEVDKTLYYCDSSDTKYPCVAGKHYYGRGPLQLSWYLCVYIFLFGKQARNSIECLVADRLLACLIDLSLCKNYNYGAAGDYLGMDLLKNPDLVAQNDSTSWKTALWFWNVNTNCHTAMASGQGFWETIKAIGGGIACNTGNIDQINDRINNYIRFCTQLGVEPGYNVAC